MSQKRNKIFDLKFKDGYTNSTKRAMNLISIDSRASFPFGTFIYRANPFPGDIDMLEYVIVCCNKKEIIKKFKDGLKKIINRIKKIKGYFLGDVKIGLDDAFLNIALGEFNKNKLKGYNSNKIKKQIVELFKKKYLTKEEFENIISLIKKNPTEFEYQKLKEVIRKKYIVRWTLKELDRGYKILPGNRKLTIEEAIQQPTLTKIDFWASVDNKFVEITNVFILVHKDKTGKESILNFTNDDILKELLKDIFKYNTDYFYKPFKMTKRMFSYARLTNNVNLATKVVPLLRSYTGRLSQITSEIETLITMFKNIKNPPLKKMLRQIDNIKKSVANILSNKFDIKLINDTINLILNNKTNLNNKILLLSELKKYFTKIINDNTEIYLKKHKLLPLPSNLLPK